MKETSVEEINRMMLDQEVYDGLAEAVEESEREALKKDLLSIQDYTIKYIAKEE